jgi:hypothetical protein
MMAAICSPVTMTAAYESGASVQGKCTQSSYQDGAKILNAAVLCADRSETAASRSRSFMRSNFDIVVIECFPLIYSAATVC